MNSEISQSFNSLSLSLSLSLASLCLLHSVFLHGIKALLLPLMANQDQAPSSTASQSNAHHELSPMEDLRSPFLLHHGESPSAILVTQL